MRASAGIDIGWVGFGLERGLLQGIKLGPVRLWWCRGSLYDRVKWLEDSLARALAELGRGA